jgi:hypothetical protein
MGRRPKIDWDAAFADWISLPPPERVAAHFAERLRVGRTTLFKRMREEHWEQRTALIDKRVRERREAEGIRKLEERDKDSLDIIEIFRRRYAQRLVRDSSYKPTAMEFAAMIRTERLIEGQDTIKVGVSVMTDEFRESVGQLPVYVQQWLLLAALTGVNVTVGADPLYQPPDPFGDVGDIATSATRRIEP